MLSPGALVAQTLVTADHDQPHRPARVARPGEPQPDPDDRRGVRVRLTTRGKEAVDSALADLLDRERGLLAELDEASLSSLAAQLRRLVAPFDVPR